MRLILFVDPAMANGMDLLAACLQLAAVRNELEPIAVVDTALAPPFRLELPRARGAWAARRLLNVNTRAEPRDAPPRASVTSLARRRRIPVLAPRAAGVNDPRFVEAVERLEPDIALSLMVSQIFRAPLLAACGTPVNYHPGLLPDYQGVDPTGWSIYRGEPTSGFSFHLMSEQIDRGPILLQGAVALGPSSVTAPVERAKTRLARSRLNELFDLLARPLAGARRQDRPGSSFSRADSAAIRDVEQPERLTLAELELRLRAFEIVDLTLAGRRWRTTALRRARRRARSGRLAFTTADGVAVEPSRVLHLPPLTYRTLLPAIRSA
ncbi:MAG TPA: formyltransferase family protein [Solirubrobacteraceae bacterium]|jgi:methionyl-tRNA formyltransferase|nr:formyltransferase family protein [Solirubrobacteraceae bacterium]